jgi:hypothetical protein
LQALPELIYAGSSLRGGILSSVGACVSGVTIGAVGSGVAGAVFLVGVSWSASIQPNAPPMISPTILNGFMCITSDIVAYSLTKFYRVDVFALREIGALRKLGFIPFLCK